MAVTRIKNNQITDSTVTGAKLVTRTITAGLLEDNLTYGSNLTVSGNLTVNGTTTTVDTTNTLIADPLFVLSRGETGTPSADSGFIVERGTSNNVAFIWDESADVFAAVNTTEDGGTAGDITISSYASARLAGITAESATIDNIQIDGNTIVSTDSNGDINLTPDGTGQVVASTFVASDLTSGRVVLAGTSGVLEDNSNLTFNGSTLVVTGATTISTTLGVTGESTLASATISDLTSGRVVLAGTSGAIEDSGNLTFDGSTLAVTGATTISTTLGVSGESTLASATISDLTDGRVVLAGTSGAIEDSGNLTFNGSTLAVTGAVTVSTTLGVTGESTLASATISDLTDGRVVLAGTSGAIEDSGNLTFDGSTLSITGDVDVSGDVAGATATVSGNATVGGTLGVTGATTLSSTLGVTGESTLASATVSDLTDGRVVLAGTSGAIEDSGNLTFDGSTLGITGDVDASGDVAGATATVSGNATVGGTLGVTGESTLASATVSDLTSGRLTYAGTGGALQDDANLSWSGFALDVTGDVDVSGDVAGATATVSGNATVGGTLGVTGESTLASATVSDLTSGRVVLAGTSGAIEDSGNLTFNGSTLAVTGATTISTTLGVTGESTLASATVSDLTSGRVVLAGTSGAIEDSANLTFDGTTLESTKITVDNISIDGDTISSVHNELTIDPATAGSGGTVIIAGNLQVTGTTTTVNSTVVTIADPLFQLGADSNDALDRGITALYNDGASKTAFFGMDDSALEFVFIPDATDSASVISGSLGSAAFGSMRVTDLTNNRILVAGANGEIEDSSSLTFDGTDLVAGSLVVSDLTADRVLLAGTSGAVEDSANLTFDGSTLAVSGDLDVDNININGNTIISTNTNGDINLTPDGTGEVVASTLTVSDLTDNRVVLAGTSGAIEDSGNLTFDGSTLAVTGATTISTTLGVTGESTLASATISDLTDGRVVLAGTSGAIEDSGNLTFDGSTLAVTGDVDVSGDVASATATISGNSTIGGTLGVTGESTLASATVSDLTDGRVVLAGTSGAIEDSANLTFNGSTLGITGDVDVSGDVAGATATISGNSTIGGTLGVTGATTLSSTLGVTGESTLASATISDLTDGRVVLAGTSGAIEDSGNLTFNGSTLAVTGDITASGDVDVTTNATVGGTLGVTGESTLASAIVSDLTSGRVVLAGTSGAIEDSGNLTFDGSTLAVTGAVTVSTTLGVTGESTLASAIVSDLTSGRVVLAGTSGAIEDSGNLTFDGSTLTVSGELDVDNININGNSISSSNALTLDAAASQSIVVNEAGADVDVRIEASGQANALFIEGSTGNIGFRTATPTAGAVLTVNATSSIIVPNGTTSERPGTPAAAMLRYNNSTTQLEFYNGTEWVIAGAEFTIITADSFNGDGSTVAFTLSEDATSAGLLVAINGVLQDPGTAYSVSGSTLTFTEAPATGDNIDARIITTTTTVTELSDGSTTVIVDGAAETVTIVGGDLDLNGNDILNAGNIVATEAATLSTARTIGGVSFDGSANINLPGVNTSGNQDTSGNAATATALETARTIGGVSFDGSANINLPGVNTAGNQNTSGNAATATALATARTIGGVSFDGSANINLPGVNTAGNQNTSGNAATATALATARTIGLSGDVSGSGSFDGTGNLTISATIADDSHNHVISNVDGLQTALDAKAALAGATFTGNVAGTNLTLSGDLTVNGTTTTLATTNTVVSDNLIELNNGVSSNANDSGIIIERGSTGNNAFIGWDESADKFIVGTTTATGASTGDLAITKGTLLADIEGNVTGNASTATTLETARTIGGVSFNGSANINLPGVNTAGNQDTSGNAATATKWATARTITLGGDLTGNASIDGSANVTLTATVAANSVALGTDTTGNYVQQGATSGNGISGSVNSEGGTFTVTSNATNANTGSTIVFRDASGNFSAGTITATATSAKYADLAENYTADADYAPGTVVSFGGDAEVTVNGVDMDRKVAGVVSTDPAHLMNADCAGNHVVALALQGRVPCKVTGAVEKGDLMVAAGNGFARAEADPKVGAVIGKALEAHTSGTGVIEVAVGRF